MEEITNKERKWICECISMYCWTIWKHKNDIIFNGKQWNINLLLSNACRLIKDLGVLAGTQEMEKNEERRWIPPKDDFVKMNFDGAHLQRIRRQA